MHQFWKCISGMLSAGFIMLKVISPSVAGSLPASVPCQGGACYQPALHTPWNYVLSTTPNFVSAAQMFDIDMFEATVPLVNKAHAAGKKTICYMSAGSSENWREDFKQFPGSVLGKNMDGWPGEKWLDIRNITVLAPVMTARLNLCKAKGFDGVEFDNVDGYANDSGFPLSANDQLKYNIFLANEAHKRGLTAALKNDLDQIPTLVNYFDYAVNEQCMQYGECSALKPFIDKRKPVFNVEYSGNIKTINQKAKALHFNSIKKSLDLNNTVQFAQ